MAMVALGRQLWAPTESQCPGEGEEQMGFLLALASAGVAGEEGAVPALQKGECGGKPQGDS